MKIMPRTLLLLITGSLLFACNATDQIPLTSTAAATPSPLPSATWTPTATITPSVTPTQAYILLATQFTELRDGPNKNAALIGHPAEGTVLVVFEKAMWLGWWYHVRVQGTDEEGWVSHLLVDAQFRVYEVTIPALSEIPITATPLPPTLTPVLPRTVTITFINELDQPMEVRLRGPHEVDFTLAAHGTKTVHIAAGSYRYSVKSDGYEGMGGLVTWEDGFTDTWDITIK